jgi:hypothetical protein
MLRLKQMIGKEEKILWRGGFQGRKKEVQWGLAARFGRI